MEKKPRALSYLLLIPAQCLLDFALLYLAVRLDSLIFASADPQLGHPFPAVTLLVGALLSIVSVVVCIAAVALTVRGFALRKKMAEGETLETSDDSAEADIK